MIDVYIPDLVNKSGTKTRKSRLYKHNDIFILETRIGYLDKELRIYKKKYLNFECASNKQLKEYTNKLKTGWRHRCQLH